MLLPDIVLKNNVSLLFLSFFLFISCDHKHKEYAKGVLFYSGFPPERELIGEVIELDTALLRYPFRIRIEGDRVIVMDLHGLDHYDIYSNIPVFSIYLLLASVVIHLRKCYHWRTFVYRIM